MLTRTVALYLRNPAFRAYMKARRYTPKDLFAYLGYAILTGGK
jgi:hypothetical protein